MPYDQAGRAKLYPDAQVNFKWHHEASGILPSRGRHILGTLNCDGEPDHGLAKAQGYMCSRTDWKNVEQKVYFDGQAITLSLGGGLYKDSNPCLGFAYEISFNTNGIIKLRKKTWHIHYDMMKQIDNGVLPDGFKGVAFVRFNISNNQAVRLEAWVDKGTAGNWKQVMIVTDDGNTYGNAGSKCNGTDKEAGVWGFPVVSFATTDTNGCNFLSMTAREINPFGTFNESGMGGGIPRPSAGGGGTPLPAEFD